MDHFGCVKVPQSVSARDEGEIQGKEWTYVRPSLLMAEHFLIKKKATPPISKLDPVELPTVPPLPPILIVPCVEVDTRTKEEEFPVTPTTAMLISLSFGSRIDIALGITIPPLPTFK